MQDDRTLLILSQVYVPDPASVGQHIADAAAEMVRRGWRVRVLTSARGYNDPSIKYPPRETIDGVEVIRLPLSSFGKKSLPIRALAAFLFMLQTIIRGVFTPGISGPPGRSGAILVSTSPPMCIIAALIIRIARFGWGGRVPIKFWVMDINPDQLISLGKIGPNSLPAKLMNFFNRWILGVSSDVVVLDKFMARTMNAKRDVSSKMAILPPWPHEDTIEPIAHKNNPFREQHGLNAPVSPTSAFPLPTSHFRKRVIMYSGNHGIALPLETFLKAAIRFKDDPRVAFLFIGDGVRKKEVEAAIRDHSLTNMLSLPYQPLSTLRFSLSAADAHLVSVGNESVGTIHPCKIYGAMAVARPIVLLAPDPCHVSDLVSGERAGAYRPDEPPITPGPIGWHIPHGDIDRAEQVIREIIEAPADRLAAMGSRARHMIETQLSKPVLCGAFCDVLERGLKPASLHRQGLEANPNPAKSEAA